MVTVSVIVPVKNGDNHIKCCVQSILDQTLQELEIIIIDDASTDMTVNIVRNMMKHDQRISLIANDTTVGAGESRNIGLKEATGQAIIFFDADDIVHKGCIKMCYEALRHNEADICFLPYEKRDDSTTQCTYFSMPGIYQIKDTNFLDKEIVFRHLFHFYNWAPWTRMYQRQFIISTKLKYQDLDCINDMYFGLMAVVYAKKMIYVHTDQALYTYRYHVPNQITAQHTYRYDCYFHAMKSIIDQLEPSEQHKVIKSYNSRMITMMMFYYKHSERKIREKLMIDVKKKILKKENMKRAFLYISDYLTYERLLAGESDLYDNTDYYDHADAIETLFDNYKDRSIAIWGYGQRGKRLLHYIEKHTTKDIVVTDISFSNIENSRFISIDAAIYRCDLFFYTNSSFKDSIVESITDIGFRANNCIIFDIDAFLRLGLPIKLCATKLEKADIGKGDV